MAPGVKKSDIDQLSEGNQDRDLQVADNDADDDDLEKLDEEDESIPASTQFDQIQSRLLGSLNRELVDQIALDFAWINSKGARKRLVRLLVLHSKSRADLIPFFARLIACLYPYIPEIGKIVIKTVRRFDH